MEHEFRLLRSFSTALEAEIVRGRLESAGIQCQLRDEYVVSTNWLYSNALGGVKLCVLCSQFEEAVQILAQEAEVEVPNESSEKVIPLWGACPSCKSSETEYRTNGFFGALSFVLLGFPVFRPKRLLYCRSCGLSSDLPKS